MFVLERVSVEQEWPGGDQVGEVCHPSASGSDSREDLEAQFRESLSRASGGLGIRGVTRRRPGWPWASRMDHAVSGRAAGGDGKPGRKSPRLSV